MLFHDFNLIEFLVIVNPAYALLVIHHISKQPRSLDIAQHFECWFSNICGRYTWLRLCSTMICLTVMRMTPYIITLKSILSRSCKYHGRVLLGNYSISFLAKMSDMKHRTWVPYVVNGPRNTCLQMGVMQIIMWIQDFLFHFQWPRLDFFKLGWTTSCCSD